MPTNVAAASYLILLGRSGGRDPGPDERAARKPSTTSARPRSGLRNTGRHRDDARCRRPREARNGVGRGCPAALRAAEGPLRHAGAPDHPADRVPDRGGGRGRCFNRIKEGTTFDAVAAERNISAAGPRTRHLHQGRDGRPGRRRRGIRARGRRVERPGRRAGSAPVLVRVTQSPARGRPAVRGGRGRDQPGDAPASAPRNASRRCTTRSRTMRAAAKPLAEIAKEKNLTLVQSRPSTRNGRDKAGKPVGTCPSASARAGRLRLRHRRRQRGSAQPRRRLCLVRGDRHRAGPRADARRGRGRGRRPVAGGRRSPSAWPTRRASWSSASTRARRSRPWRSEVGAQAKTATDLARATRRRAISPPRRSNRIFATPVGKAGSAPRRNGQPRAVFKVTAADGAAPRAPRRRRRRAIDDQLRRHGRRPDRLVHRAGPQTGSRRHDQPEARRARPSAAKSECHDRRARSSRPSPRLTRPARPGVVCAPPWSATSMTPVAAFLKLRHGRQGAAFLLESVEGGAVRGRYSMIGLDPDLVWRCQDGVAAIDRQRAEPAGARSSRATSPPLESLRALIAESALPLGDDLPPMAAGLFGYLGYDMVRLMERLPAEPGRARRARRHPGPADRDGGVRRGARRDLAGHARCARRPAFRAKAAYEAALARLERGHWRARAARCPSTAAADPDRASISSRRSRTRRRPSSRPMVAQRQGIHPGRRHLPGGAVAALRGALPAARLRALPLAAARQSGAVPVLPRLRRTSRSSARRPEILVRVRDGKVTIRPIAGTRPRGATAAEDKAHADELLADPKERAEHLMLLDLGRNDVGRVSEIGTVEVTDSFFLERYSQVMHIVSNVEGTLDPRHDALDALVAGFPGRHRLRRAEGARHGDHRRAGEGQARPLCRLHRLFRRQWRDGHLHRPAHRRGEGRAHVRRRPAPASSTTATPPPSSRNASTRPRRCSAPPRRPCASRAPREASDSDAAAP